MSKKNPIAIGDRVAFSAAFLRNTGQPYETSLMRGIVQTTEDFGENRLCRVNWDRGCPSSVLATNLARVGSLAFAEP